MIPVFEPSLGERERRYLLDCIESGWISSQGRFITAFEEAFARHMQMPYAVATSSCTTALHLSMTALGIGPGDEVLCPDLTFIAPANMIRLTGAKEVLVDVDPVSWAMDPALAATRLTERTRAMVIVHPFGHTADMDPLLALAAEHDLKVIEDAAEAPDALYEGRKVGTFGDVACYSFFANKIMTTGEGGMVTARDAEVDKALRVLRDHGMSREKRYVHIAAGFNYRMTNMQAAVGLAQLERIDEIMAGRQVQAERYAGLFAGSKGISWRPTAAYCRPVHWMATVTLAESRLRDPLLEHLAKSGVDARQMVFPVHMAVPYREDYGPEGFPVSRSISLRSLHLPSATGLKSDDVDRIAETVIRWVENHYS